MLSEEGIELGLAGGDTAAVEAVLAVVGEEGGRAVLRWRILPIGGGHLLVAMIGAP